jgi:hypothetical protein
MAQQRWQLASAHHAHGRGQASSAPTSAVRRGDAGMMAAAVEGRSRNISAWGDALTNAVATSPSHWSDIAGHVFDGAARRVSSSLDGGGGGGGSGGGPSIDGLFNHAFSAVSRVSESIGDVGSYLPAPPIPLPSSMSDVQNYLPPPPAAMLQGVTGALRNLDRVAELAPNAAAYATAGGLRAAAQID